MLLNSDKSKDGVYYSLYIVCLIFFGAEVVVYSVIQEGYKFSFPFWLEILASVSLIPKIDWISEPLSEYFGLIPASQDVDVLSPYSSSTSTSASTLSNVLTSFLFIKFLRIVKLYKYCVQATIEEDIEEGAKGEIETQQQIALKEELNPNDLGKTLSDTTTRKVLLGVIMMYIAFPLLTQTSPSSSFQNGLKQLFIAGSSTCNYGNNGYCGHNYLTPLGWFMMLQNFIDIGKPSFSGGSTYEVLWLNVPNFNKSGKIEDILSIPGENNVGSYWTSDLRCSGYVVSYSSCPYRASEMQLISYTPADCANGPIKGCEDLTVYTRILIRDLVVLNAKYSFVMIVFTTALLFIAAISVGNDTTHIVVTPITKMINVVRSSIDSPLKLKDAPKAAIQDSLDNEDTTQTMKTRVLKQVFSQVTKLLQMGYGKLGAKIVCENLLTKEGDLDLMRPGVKIEAIFLVCRINRFSEVTEALQEEITVFVNKFCKIIHDCVEFWGGSANKNTGDIFLLTWKLPVCDNQDPEEKTQQKLYERSEIAAKSLITSIKIFAEIRRAIDLKAYSRHPKIKNK